MIKIPAKSVSYGGIRSLSSVRAIVMHYTAGTGDTAVNQGNYFKNVNTRSAGAHFFVDQQGEVVESIPMERIAWAVGGSKYTDCSQTGGGRYYGVYSNSNTVSIEMCDIVNKEPSDSMVKAVKSLITHIQANCPNATTIIRHFDVNGKHCPASMMSADSWNKFLRRIDKATASSTTSGGSATKQKGKKPEDVKMTTIKQGSKGKAVKVWQAIVDAGIDGDFGPNTLKKTKAFQKKKGLVEDGIVGDKTWKAGLKSV